MTGTNTFNEPYGKSATSVAQGTWLKSSGERITLQNPEAAARLTEEDRATIAARGITLQGDVFSIPDVLLPIDQTFYPPIPEPKHKDDQPPETSTDMLVSANPVDQLFVQSSKGTYFPTSGKFKEFPVRIEPPFPATAKLAYRRFWQNTFTTRILNAQQFTRAIETVEGMSETDATVLAGKLGLDITKKISEKLSLKLSGELSKTTSHSITISESRKVTETYNFGVEQGKVALYTLWQLIEVFALVDGNNNPLDWTGKVVLDASIADFRFNAKFPPDRHTNNAERYATSLHMFDA
jgi:hypothetical protein